MFATNSRTNLLNPTKKIINHNTNIFLKICWKVTVVCTKLRHEIKLKLSVTLIS